MICEKCGNEFIEDFRRDGWSIRNTKPRFCSRACANSKSQTEEMNANRSVKIKQAHIEGRCKSKCPRSFTAADREKGIATQRGQREGRVAELLAEGKYEKLSEHYRRNLLLNEANHTCESCGLSEWLGQKIWLEVHHKNDDNSDNRKENLMVVCLNCHSILDKNYRNRGRSSKEA